MKLLSVDPREGGDGDDRKKVMTENLVPHNSSIDGIILSSFYITQKE
jgi:hypothetical protein